MSQTTIHNYNLKLLKTPSVSPSVSTHIIKRLRRGNPIYWLTEYRDIHQGDMHIRAQYAKSGLLIC